MRTIAIDPGPVVSAWCVLDAEGIPTAFSTYTNEVLWGGGAEALVEEHGAEALVIEQVACYGMIVGEEVFETVYWTGRFVEVFGLPFERLKRLAVKMNLCHDSRAKDSNIRQALIDRFGGKFAAIGGKKCPNCKGKGWRGIGRPACTYCESMLNEAPARGSGWLHPPGPLYGMAGDQWAALAVGVTAFDKRENQHGR